MSFLGVITCFTRHRWPQTYRGPDQACWQLREIKIRSKEKGRGTQLNRDGDIKEISCDFTYPCRGHR